MNIDFAELFELCLYIMIPSINPLVLNLKESAALSVNIAVKRLRRQGRSVYHFGFGQAAFPVPGLIQEALRTNAHRNDYLPAEGLPELQQAVEPGFHRYRGGFHPLHRTPRKPGDQYVRMDL